MNLRLAVPAEGVLPSEAWREGSLLKGVVDGGRLPEEVAHRHAQPWPVEGVKTQRAVMQQNTMPAVQRSTAVSSPPQHLAVLRYSYAIYFMLINGIVISLLFQ